MNANRPDDRPVDDVLDSPRVLIVGLGAVGRCIAMTHLDAGIAITVADVSPSAVESFAAGFPHQPADLPLDDDPDLASMHACHLWPASPAVTDPLVPSNETWLVIESIAEHLETKQSFFRSLQRSLGDQAVLCSNTSTLPISKIAQTMVSPSRLAGMHFFMPVEKRSGVEVIAGEQTDPQVLRAIDGHVRRLGKEPIVVADTPGFVVNRLLGPYLNEALLIVCEGVSAERIADAAKAYGMPLSPLALIDTIGLRTTFNAGNVYWAAFPHRIDPAPLLGRSIKKGRLGQSVGKGILDQDSGSLATETVAIADRYRRDSIAMTDEELVDRLSLPMAIEAACMRHECSSVTTDLLDLAMRGGLGFQYPGIQTDGTPTAGNRTTGNQAAGNEAAGRQNRRPGWTEYFQHLAPSRIRGALDRFGPISAALRLPPAITADDLHLRSR